MTDGVQRAMARQIRCAWEIYAVTELGMSAGAALRAFDNWQDSVSGSGRREGLRKAVAIIQGEDYPKSHGLVSVSAMVRDIEDEISMEVS